MLLESTFSKNKDDADECSVIQVKNATRIPSKVSFLNWMVGVLH